MEFASGAASVWGESFWCDEHELDSLIGLAHTDDPFTRASQLTGRLSITNRFSGVNILRWFHPIKFVRAAGAERRAELAAHGFPPGVRVQMGRQLVARKGARWLARNDGKFVAITLRGQLMAVCATLAQVYETLALQKPSEDYYVARIGFESVGSVV